MRFYVCAAKSGCSMCCELSIVTGEIVLVNDNRDEQGLSSNLVVYLRTQLDLERGAGGGESKTSGAIVGGVRGSTGIFEEDSLNTTSLGSIDGS